MKTCTDCGIEKEEVEFHKRGKTFQAWCKICRADYQRKLYKNSEGKLKEKLVEQERKRLEETRSKVAEYLLKHPCVECGESNILKLDFDHVGDKKFDIAHALWRRYSWKKIEQEVKQCQVLCANCHRVKSLTNAGSWKVKYMKGLD